MEKIIKRNETDRIYGGPNEIYLRREQGGIVNWVTFNERIIEKSYEELKVEGYVIVGNEFVNLGEMLDNTAEMQGRYDTVELRDEFEERFYMAQEYVKAVFNF